MHHHSGQAVLEDVVPPQHPAPCSMTMGSNADSQPDADMLDVPGGRPFSSGFSLGPATSVPGPRPCLRESLVDSLNPAARALRWLKQREF